MAFDYPEHRQMALDGIVWARTHLTDSRGALLEEMLGELRASLASKGSGKVCERDRFAGLADNACFDAGDIPALAGDHASSVDALVARFFTGVPAPDSVSMVHQYVSGAAHARRIQEPPGSFDRAIVPDRAKILRIVRDHALDSDALLEQLAAVDGALLRLAAHNATHFWLYRSYPKDAATSTLTNAHAAYAALHWQATNLARRASVMPAGDERRKQLLGRALLVELYGYHFLEDSLAAGHIASNRLELSAASSYATHNGHNASGVAVRTTPALRQRADEIDDTQFACAEAVTLTYGDGVLIEYVWHRAPSEDGAIRKRRVLAMGAALVAFSLEELIVAATSCSAPASCYSLPPDEDAAPTPDAVRAALASPWGRPLDEIPVPVEWPRVLYNVDMGAAFRLSASTGVSVFGGGGHGAAAESVGLSAAGLIYVPDSPRLRTLGMGILGLEANANLHTPGSVHVRPTAVDLKGIGGYSNGHWAFEAAFGGGAATAGGYATLTDATTRAAFAASLRVVRRWDTQNDYALSWFLRPDFHYQEFGGHSLFDGGLALGLSLERWRVPRPVCSAVEVPGGRPMHLVDSSDIDCFHRRDRSYDATTNGYSSYITDLARPGPSSSSKP